MTPDDMRKIADDTRRMMIEMGFTPKITSERLVDILKSL